MLEASIPGLFKTILIILGAVVLLRFLGRVMIAKRNLDEERALLQRERNFQRERNEKLKNFGKVSVMNNRSSKPTPKAEDVDFEELT